MSDKVPKKWTFLVMKELYTSPVKTVHKQNSHNAVETSQPVIQTVCFKKPRTHKKPCRHWEIETNKTNKICSHQAIVQDWESGNK